MKRKLNDKEKIFIGYNHDKMSVYKIGKEINRHPSTVYFFIKRFLKRGYIKNHVGYKKHKLNFDDDNNILNYLKDNPQATIKEIIKNLNLNVCYHTLYRQMKRLKLRYSNIPFKPKLTERQIQKRLEFATKYKNWTVNDWKQVAFLDESSVVIGQKYKKKSWKKPKTKQYLHTMKKFSIQYFKVVSFISYYGVSPLIKLENRWKSDEYIKILNDILIPKMKELIGNKAYLLQDNDTVHKSTKTLNFLKDNNIQLIPFPPNSPDLNPIENSWFLMKKKLAEFPSLNKDLVVERAKKIWEELPKQTLENLISSMPNRIKQVLENKGNLTSY